jgi:hypothetical protein
MLEDYYYVFKDIDYIEVLKEFGNILLISLGVCTLLIMIWGLIFMFIDTAMISNAKDICIGLGYHDSTSHTINFWTMQSEVYCTLYEEVPLEQIIRHRR